MTYRMFIDDERFPPNDGKEWVIVRSSYEAMAMVADRGVPNFISYDHDLGEKDTSIIFIHWMMYLYLDGDISVFPTEFAVHSQNPVGARNITALLLNFIETVNPVSA
jgi:hypothetical protein